jgi:hypothetical protein
LPVGAIRPHTGVEWGHSAFACSGSTRRFERVAVDDADSADPCPLACFRGPGGFYGYSILMGDDREWKSNPHGIDPSDAS